MSVVARIFSESILDFVRREGPVTTAAVSYRFGMIDIRDARKALKALEKSGEVRSRREKFDYCAMSVWFAPDSNGLKPALASGETGEQIKGE